MAGTRASDTTERDEAYVAFNDAVNMSASHLGTWLDSDESRLMNWGHDPLK